jgi:protein-lysine N-methyltransferase EEF2KMT
MELVTVIHCWSAPRSRSTALLYSFEARNQSLDDATDSRNNTVVALDEPLYATWLLHEANQTNANITRPYLPYIQKAAGQNVVVDEDDAEPVLLQQWKDELIPFSTKIQMAASTLQNESNGSKVIFCKHMAKFWNVYHREENEISEVTIAPDRIVRLQHYHVLLLRDPMDVVTSWNAIGTSVYGPMSATSSTGSSNDNGTLPTTSGGNTIYEIGMVPLLQIYSELQNHNPSSVFVLDAEELIQHPESTLQRLCLHCHIPYTNAMYVDQAQQGCFVFEIHVDTLTSLPTLC